MADPRIAHRLREMPLFADVRPKELALLALVMQEVHFNAGDLLCRIHEPADSCYFIVEGEVEVLNENARGDARHLATLGPGMVVGQIALVDEDPRSATCVARSATYALQLDKSDFDMLFSSGSQFAYRFQALIALTTVDQLRQANRRLNEVIGGSNAEDDIFAQVQRILEGRS